MSALFCLLQSLCNSQDAAVDSPQQPGSPRGPFLGLPKGTIRRQTSIGVWLFHFVLLLKYIFTKSIILTNFLFKMKKYLVYIGVDIFLVLFLYRSNRRREAVPYSSNVEIYKKPFNA